MKDRLNKAMALMGGVEFLGEQVVRVSELQNRLCSRELVIAVIGQFKRGKSSLINALLGDELLPVGIVPLTTVVTEIRKGETFKAMVSFIDGSEHEIERQELPDYISEEKNHDNKKNVEKVELWAPHTPLEPGLTLVDTPGVGSVHQHNTETSYRYIEKSDAVLFLLSVDSPVSELERDFLLKAREHAAKFYFAINKTDIVSEIELKEFLAYCRAVLSESLGSDVALYALSAKTGQGVSQLADKLLGDLRFSHDRLLESSITLKLEAVIEQAIAKLNLYLRAAAIPADELETKLTQIRQEQSKLAALSNEVETLAKRQTEKLVESVGEQLDSKAVKLREGIESKAMRLRNELGLLPSRQFERKLLAGLEGLMQDNLTMLNAEGLALLDKGYALIVNVMNKKGQEIARFISNLVRDQFDLEYPLPVREFSLSERDDFYIRLSHNRGFFIDTNVFTHLLPRARANRIIYERGMKRLFDDIASNKNNMVYNYNYKIRESLRAMNGELAADIAQMRGELDDLLAQVEHGHKVKRGELRQTKEDFRLLIGQLDALNADKKNGSGASSL